MRQKMFLSVYLPTIFIHFIKKQQPFVADKKESLIIASAPLSGENYVARCSRQLMVAGMCNTSAAPNGGDVSEDSALSDPITPGMKLSHACSLVPHAKVCQFSYRDEQKYLEIFARSAYRYSPICGIDRDPAEDADLFKHRFVGINLDISGSERLFGGHEKFLIEIIQQLNSLGLYARLSISNSLGAAWAFSRFHSKRCSLILRGQLRTELEQLPLAALRLSSVTEKKLTELNIRRIGEVLAISRRSLISRFGYELISRLDQALGVSEEPILQVPPEKPICLQHDFLRPVGESEILKNIIQLLLEKTKNILEQDGRVISKFRVKIERDGVLPITKFFSIQLPTASLKHVAKRLHIYLDQLDYTWGILSLQLEVMASEPLTGTNLMLSNISNGPDIVNASLENQAELIDRLRDRVGEHRLLELKSHDSYFPERAYSFGPYYIRGLEGASLRRDRKNFRISRAKPCAAKDVCTDETSDSEHTTHLTRTTAYLGKGDRPSVLLPQPEKIRAIAVIPDSIPVQLTCRHHIYSVIKGLGPERISGEWWLSSEGIPSSRDYFKVQLNTGEWVWIFRDIESGSWYLHGIWR